MPKEMGPTGTPDRLHKKLQETLVTSPVGTPPYRRESAGSGVAGLSGVAEHGAPTGLRAEMAIARVTYRIEPSVRGFRDFS